MHYVANQPNQVRRHFHGLREAAPDLKGVAVFDRLEQGLPDDLGALGLVWRRREIENYLCCQEALEAYALATARSELAGPLFAAAESSKRLEAMRESIEEVAQALDTLGKGSPWDADTKVSDDFLAPLFQKYFSKLELPNVMGKKNFHELAGLVPEGKLDPEVRGKLDAIAQVARSARAGEEPEANR